MQEERRGMRVYNLGNGANGGRVRVWGRWLGQGKKCARHNGR